MGRIFSNRSRPSNRFAGRSRFPQKASSFSYSDLVRTIDTSKRIAPVEVVEAAVIAPPQVAFSDFGLSSMLLSNIAKKGYTDPTPVQTQAIPHILRGADVIGIANTGTGKTGAFLIPLIEKLLKNNSEKIFILAPTRELAVQIQEEFLSLTRGMYLRTAICVGGTSIYRQKSELYRNPAVVIGTPGRIKDLIGQRILNLASFHTVVLDEADRMVDIGFINDIKYFISLFPVDRQSLFFSATISNKVKEVLNAFVKNPVTVSVVQKDTASTIEQNVIKIERGQRKIDKLHELLSQKEFGKVLVFGKTKWGVQRLSVELASRGFRTGSIHGNKKQNQRIRTLDAFKRSEIQVLLATDVAARGLDIPDVTHVINYDMPDSKESYVHRIGRTGRAEKRGIALTFVESY